MSRADLDALEAAARAATPGPWIRLFGERTLYDRLEDGCRGNAIVRADNALHYQDADNLDFIAAANPAVMLQLIERLRTAEAALASQAPAVQREPDAISQATARDLEKAIRAIKVAGEFTPELRQAISPASAINLLSYLLADARDAPSPQADAENALSDDELWQLAQRHGFARVVHELHDANSWRVCVLTTLRAAIDAARKARK